MARQIVKLPDAGEGTTEAEIVAWHVKPGDLVEEDDTLVEVMTDKATVELPAPRAGRVVAIHGEVGEKRAVGSDLVELEIEGADEREPAPPSPPTRGEGRGEGQPAAAPSSAKPLASPAVRKRAADRGIALETVTGTGPGGRVTQGDLDARPIRPSDSRDEIETVPVIGLRRAIAAHLEESHSRIPHFSYVEEVDVGAVEALRARLNADRPDRPHLTLLPFLMRAVVRAVAAHPQVNARFDDEAGTLSRYRAVHLGIATQTDSGLVVPVVRHAETRDLWQAAAEIARLAEAARAGKASRDELSGSTITISSLGPLGGIAATPIINRPEVAIVGVNKIVARPVVRDGQVAVAQMMNLSSSFDHRIVDGWEAASFIQRVKAFLEMPAAMFID
ncbi:MAG TPA: dihydrolipoamide acetyltransferase family protein [Stellaceae bacterium]|nr:dihydrolipoamide acetyltransferase family protein [Stellaceae bacterium]